MSPYLEDLIKLLCIELSFEHYFDVHYNYTGGAAILMQVLMLMWNI